MFTGLIEEIGRVAAVRPGSHSAVLTISADLADQLRPGDSVAVSGACQTVTAVRPGRTSTFTVEAQAATLEKTTLGSLRPGTPVNLERALAVGDRLDGHFVQGHINGTAPVTALHRNRSNVHLSLTLSPQLLAACRPEGSLTVDGVSLTIAQILSSRITLSIIPHTFTHTTLQNQKPGSQVNIETDILLRRTAPSITAPSITADRLRALGYG